MEDACTCAEDLFAIPLGDGKYYLYSPLRRFLAVVNGTVVDAAAQYARGRAEDLSPAMLTAIQPLKDRGILDGPAPAPPLFPDNYTFCPHEVTLFPTSRCNLRCRYCYANAGSRANDMPWAVARAAIDLVARNAGLLGSRTFAVGFHGGGEPTLAWDLLARCVEYAHQKAEEMGLDAEFFAATNGLLSPEQRDYVVQHFKTVNVSLDGPRDIQDYHRPQCDGSGSFDDVAATLRHFDKHKFRYSLRATITAHSADRMESIVAELCGNFRPHSVHMEPSWFCGRCLTTGERGPDDAVFVENFVKAEAKSRAMGVALTYSGSRVGVLTSKFCGAPGDGFSVLPEGVATSCYEVTDIQDPRAEVFHFGHYDWSRDEFVFDMERIAALRRLSVDHLPFCADCFCKWHCAGDCLAKAFEQSGTLVHQGTSRCQLNRSLTLRSFNRIIELCGVPAAVESPGAGG